MKVNINVASAGSKSNVNLSYPQSYYDGLSKQWAISENIVNGEDYSSKHYAQESKKQTNLATEQATIATNKVNEVIDSGNEALSKISAQETTSKNVVKTEGENQVAKIKQEGSNYATKSEATYTAGTGIAIENNVISNTQTSAEWGNIQGDIQNQKDLIELININDIELNNPFVLFTSHYVEVPLYNISWLKSDGEYKPKATYPKAYEALVVEQNADVAVGTTVDLPSGTKYTKRGLSVKLSTASDITDYDFVINTTDETFRLPLKNGIEGIFASGVKGNGTAIGLTNGIVECALINTNLSAQNDQIVLLANPNYYGSDIGTAAHSNQYKASSSKSWGLTTDPTKSGIVVDTTVPEGWSLYYYVGETVQNANLIDAGRIAEELTNKLNKSDIKAYIVEAYQNGASWYRVWSDGFCEQGGDIAWTSFNNGIATVSLLKPYKSAADYFVTAIRYHNAKTTTAFGFNFYSVSAFTVYANEDRPNCKWYSCGYIA